MTASLGSAGAFARLDRGKFFAAIRPLFGSLSDSQVKGIERLIDAFLLYAVLLDRRHLAYVLATSFHETGRRMQPVREGFGTSTADTIARLDRAFAAGQMRWVKNRYWINGWFGRGDVQLTHEANYSGPLRDAVLAVFGIDIHADPDLALRGDVSAFVVIEGITRGVSKRPDFTAYALEDFLNATKTDYANARKTVNPGEKDSYEKVAGYARRFEAALIAGGMPLVAARLPKALGVPVVAVPDVVPPLTANPPKRPTVTTGGFWSGLKGLFRKDTA